MHRSQPVGLAPFVRVDVRGAGFEPEEDGRPRSARPLRLPGLESGPAPSFVRSLRSRTQSVRGTGFEPDPDVPGRSLNSDIGLTERRVRCPRCPGVDRARSRTTCILDRLTELSIECRILSRLAVMMTRAFVTERAVGENERYSVPHRDVVESYDWYCEIDCQILS